MKPNEFVGFTLPIVNEGPWSYFSNGGIPEEGEETGAADEYPIASEDIDDNNGGVVGE